MTPPPICNWWTGEQASREEPFHAPQPSLPISRNGPGKCGCRVLRRLILRPGWDSDPNAVIDLDLGTRTSHAASLALADDFGQAAADYALSLVVDPATFHVSGGSDQDPFVVAGYPAVLLIENTVTEMWGGANAYYHTYHDASDRLANDPFNPSGIVYDYPFATDVVRAVVGLVATKAILVPEPGSAAMAAVGLFCVAVLRQRKHRVARPRACK